MQIDKTKFRSKEKGILKTTSLFTDFFSQQEPLYTLRDKEHKHNGQVYPSLYKLYMEMSDITEYDFANTYFESYQHWKLVCDHPEIKPYIDRWRAELELKVKSMALKEIIAQANAEDPKKRLEASKYLYEKVYVTKETKGRPSKQQIKEEAMKQAMLSNTILDDHERILSVSTNSTKAN